MIKANIFRAYDIRGLFNQDFDLQGTESIGKAYGTYLIRTSSNSKHNLRVCVGRDGRIHSTAIQIAFMKGVASTGIQVTDIGLAFSPLLFFTICDGKFDGGVNITASHNPKEYNGFKMQRADAHAICGDEIQAILQIIETKDFIVANEINEIETEDFWPNYQTKILDITHGHKNKKIVIDAGNGVTGAFAPSLFKKLGYKVIELYCDIDGNFPHHAPDPEDKKNLQDLRKKVLATKANLGIAFDGDGDRVGIVDDEGTIYNADYLLTLLAKDVLSRHPKAKIVSTVTTSNIVKEVVNKLHGEIIESPVGHSFVENKMREVNAVLGGESSGHFFFAENYYGFDDAILAAIKILEIVFAHGVPMKKHFADLPTIYTSPEIKIDVADDYKFMLVEKVKNILLEKYPCQTIDGVKADFGNGAWAICRASNTSPKVSIRAEARDDSFMKEIMSEMELLVMEAKNDM